MEEKKVTDSTPEKLEWTDSEIMDYAVQLFLDSLPGLDEKEENKSEKKSTNKGFSQEAINTLLDLSLTTEEALDKSAEITIREQQRPTWDDFFSATKKQEKIAILEKMYGGALTQEEIERFLAIE